MAEIIEGVFDFDFNADKARASINRLIADLKKLEKELEDTDKTAEELAETEKKAAAARAKLGKAINTEAKTVAGLTAKKRALLAIEKQLPGAVNLVKKSQSALYRTEKDLTDQTVKLTKASGNVGGSFLKNAAQFAAASVSVAAVKAVAIDGAKELFSLATQMEVLGAKAQTVFGDALPLVTQQAKENAAALGLTTGAYTDAAASIADLLVPLGFERETGADYSTQLLNRAAALAEWSGGAVEAEEVTKILGKSLLGEREGLKGLGIAITEADLKNRLLSKGQEKLTGDALARAKAEATLALILEKSTDAAAAYENNSDTLIRKQSELTAMIGDVKETLATALTPAFHDLAEAVLPTSAAISEAIGIVARGETDLSKYSAATREAVSWVSELTKIGGEIAETYSYYFTDVLAPIYNLIKTGLIPVFKVLTLITDSIGLSATKSGERVNFFLEVFKRTTIVVRSLTKFLQGFQNAMFSSVKTVIKGFEIIARRAVQARNAIASLSGGRLKKIDLPDFSSAIEIFNIQGKEAGKAFAEGVEEEVAKTPAAPPPVAGRPGAAGGIDPAKKKAAEAAAKEAAKERERELKAAERAAAKEAADRLAALNKLNDDLAALREADRLDALSEKDREIAETVAKFDALKNRVIEIKGEEAAEVAEVEELKNDKIREIENRYLSEREEALKAAAEKRAAAAVEAEIAAIEAEGLSRLLKIEKIKNAQLEQAATAAASERADKVAAIEENAAKVAGEVENEIKRRILAVQLREAEKVAEEKGTAEARKTVEAFKLEIEKLKTPGIDIGINPDEEGLDSLGEKIKEIALAAAGVFDDIANSVGEIFALQTEKADRAVETQKTALDKIRNNSEEYNAEQLEIEKARLEEAEAARRRAVEREKRLAAVQLLTNTLLTISKAAAQGGIAAPFTIAASLAALVAGFAKARAAAASAFFEGSDFIDPRGEYPAGRDTVPAYLNRGEAVIQTDKNKDYHNTVKAIRRGAVPADLLENVTAAYLSGGRQNVAGLFDDNARFFPSPAAVAAPAAGMDRETARRIIDRLESIEEAVSDLPANMPKTKVTADAEGIFLVTRKIEKRIKTRRRRAK